MKSKLLLIDGHNLLFQMFYGMPSRIVNSNGIAIQGVIGFVGALNKIIKIISPTHAAVLFDSETHNPRTELFEDYKANRPNFFDLPDEENPFSQLQYVYKALDYMKIKHCEVKNAETDDVIASYAIRADADTEVYISSFDSDYFQLISPRVKVIRYRGEASVICDEEYVKNKFGVSAMQYADFKALVGDNSDNVPGVRGIGPKTAAKLLCECGSVEQMLKDTSKIKNERLRLSIEDSSAALSRNISLIKLDSHSPLPFEINSLPIAKGNIKTMDVVRAIGL